MAFYYKFVGSGLPPFTCSVTDDLGGAVDEPARIAKGASPTEPQGRGLLLRERSGVPQYQVSSEHILLAEGRVSLSVMEQCVERELRQSLLGHPHSC